MSHEVIPNDFAYLSTDIIYDVLAPFEECRRLRKLRGNWRKVRRRIEMEPKTVIDHKDEMLEIENPKALYGYIDLLVQERRESSGEWNDFLQRLEARFSRVELIWFSWSTHKDLDDFLRRQLTSAYLYDIKFDLRKPLPKLNEELVHFCVSNHFCRAQVDLVLTSESVAAVYNNWKSRNLHCNKNARKLKCFIEAEEAEKLKGTLSLLKGRRGILYMKQGMNLTSTDVSVELFMKRGNTELHELFMFLGTDDFRRSLYEGSRYIENRMDGDLDGETEELEEMRKYIESDTEEDEQDMEEDDFEELEDLPAHIIKDIFAYRPEMCPKQTTSIACIQDLEKSENPEKLWGELQVKSLSKWGFHRDAYAFFDCLKDRFSHIELEYGGYYDSVPAEPEFLKRFLVQQLKSKYLRRLSCKIAGNLVVEKEVLFFASSDNCEKLEWIGSLSNDCIAAIVKIWKSGQLCPRRRPKELKVLVRKSDFQPLRDSLGLFRCDEGAIKFWKRDFHEGDSDYTVSAFVQDVDYVFYELYACFEVRNDDRFEEILNGNRLSFMEEDISDPDVSQNFLFDLTLRFYTADHIGHVQENESRNFADLPGRIIADIIRISSRSCELVRTLKGPWGSTATMLKEEPKTVISYHEELQYIHAERIFEKLELKNLQEWIFFDEAERFLRDVPSLVELCVDYSSYTRGAPLCPGHLKNFLVRQLNSPTLRVLECSVEENLKIEEHILAFCTTDQFIKLVWESTLSVGTIEAVFADWTQKTLTGNKYSRMLRTAIGKDQLPYLVSATGCEKTCPQELLHYKKTTCTEDIYSTEIYVIQGENNPNHYGVFIKSGVPNHSAPGESIRSLLHREMGDEIEQCEDIRENSDIFSDYSSHTDTD
ncbi:hypothetical protein QR680_014080 [Steinernema hermaphroditum]|uniref:Uncharacterized protein n=1 Tax=Steinernema hermaphroditum TaxID=289476 RepID=A0AA39I7M1_9BILA|nr:hypothetical protein QR680_014080 [Steinernema hermaphroditum]